MTLVNILGKIKVCGRIALKPIPEPLVWLLITGFWNDTGGWDDTQNWID